MVCLRNIRFKGKEDNSGLGIKAKDKRIRSLRENRM